MLKQGAAKTTRQQRLGGSERGAEPVLEYQLMNIQLSDPNGGGGLATHAHTHTQTATEVELHGKRDRWGKPCCCRFRSLLYSEAGCL